MTVMPLGLGSTGCSSMQSDSGSSPIAKAPPEARGLEPGAPVKRLGRLILGQGGEDFAPDVALKAADHIFWSCPRRGDGSCRPVLVRDREVSQRPEPQGDPNL